jgi:dTMP kinase
MVCGFMAQAGLFITFEGSEGCGKSTQIRRLAEFLRSLEREVVVLREPGATPIGESIRNLLQYDASASAMTPETELLLFAASRAQLVREVIRPTLARGAVILCDRFLDSTTVYQGVARALDAGEVSRINDFAVGETLPNLTLLLDLDAAEGRRRAATRAAMTKGPTDRMEQEQESFYEAVRQGYLKLAAKHSGRYAVVDASSDEVGVESAIRRVLRERFQIGGEGELYGIH